MRLWTRRSAMISPTSAMVLTLVLIAAVHVAEAETKNSSGLILSRPEACRGYTLFSPIMSNMTYLVDMDGRVIRTWKSEYEPGQSVFLLENGHLLRTGSMAFHNRTFHGGGAGGRVQEFTWDGQLVWDFEYSNDRHLLHHDIRRMPNGNILMIAWERKTANEVIAAGRRPKSQGTGELWPDCVIEVKPTGKTTGDIVWEWHVWDHLIQDHDRTKKNYGDVKTHPELIDVNYTPGQMDQLSKEEIENLKALGYMTGPDNGRPGGSDGPMGGPGGGPPGMDADWNHTNSIDYNAQLDQILLSVHEFSEIWVIDHSTTTVEAAGHTGGKSGKGGDLLYRWGNPSAYRAGTTADRRLFAQHDARWIPEGLPGEGHILVFNNGRHRPDGDYSSVVEIVPPADRLGHYTRKSGMAFGPTGPCWEYVASPKKNDFFSGHISGAHRLPNGNTFICSGANGTFFEVTPAKEIVWKYVNPVQGEPRMGPPGGRPAGGFPGGGRPPGRRPPMPHAGENRPPFPPPGHGPGGMNEPKNAVFRAFRYMPDYPGLMGKSLKPGEPIKPTTQQAAPRRLP